MTSENRDFSEETDVIRDERGRVIWKARSNSGQLTRDAMPGPQKARPLYGGGMDSSADTRMTSPRPVPGFGGSYS